MVGDLRSPIMNLSNVGKLSMPTEREVNEMVVKVPGRSIDPGASTTMLRWMTRLSIHPSGYNTWMD